MKKYNSHLFGEVDCPETFLELLQLVMQDKAHESPNTNVSYWRGQTDINWKLDSSIARRILLEHNDISAEELDRHILFSEDILLQKAKRNYYDYDEHGRLLCDLELLAKLQHHGSATRLLDFSKNVLIALWFCASDVQNRDKTGLLLGLNTDIIAGGVENTFNFKLSYTEFFEKVCSSDNIWMVDAPVVVSRVSSQDSVFLCSKSIKSKYGYFPLPKEDKYVKKIAISPELKASSLTILSECFNITPYTIFPDIQGFSNANSAKWKMSEFDRW